MYVFLIKRKNCLSSCYMLVIVEYTFIKFNHDVKFNTNKLVDNYGRRRSDIYRENDIFNLRTDMFLNDLKIK